jgi:hypothetical protein
LKSEVFEGCCELWSIAFAKPGRDKASVIEERTNEINEMDEMKKKFTNDERWHVISETSEDGSLRVIAAARTFSRIMKFADGSEVPIIHEQKHNVFLSSFSLAQNALYHHIYVFSNLSVGWLMLRLIQTSEVAVLGKRWSKKHSIESPVKKSPQLVSYFKVVLPSSTPS